MNAYTVLTRVGFWAHHQMETLRRLGHLASHPEYPGTVIVAGTHTEESVRETLPITDKTLFTAVAAEKHELPFTPRF